MLLVDSQRSDQSKHVNFEVIMRTVRYIQDTIAKNRVKHGRKKMLLEGGTLYGKCHENVPFFVETFPSLCQNLGINLEPTAPV